MEVEGVEPSAAASVGGGFRFSSGGEGRMELTTYRLGQEIK